MSVDLPAFCSSAAITAPPAPEPITQTSALSVSDSPSTVVIEIVFGASSGLGGGDSGPG